MNVEHLRLWFLINSRKFSFRENRTPYRVLVSEIMLQQTRAEVVVPYFEKWMNRFPTIDKLARASVDEVVKLWEGLGYYSRARNLHKAALQIVDEYGGIIPSETKELMKIKGVGPYTLGAIRAFAFKQREAAVDGNVIRFLSRYYLYEKDVTSQKHQEEIRKLALKLLPTKHPWEIAEAFIELGALVCKKKPLCSLCPLVSTCRAKKVGKENSLPIKKTNPQLTKLIRSVACVRYKDTFMVGEVKKGIMKGLWEFPYLESGTLDSNTLAATWQEYLGADLRHVTSLGVTEHFFTRYKAVLYPILWEANVPISFGSYEWLTLDELGTKAVSSGHRRVLKLLATL